MVASARRFRLHVMLVVVGGLMLVAALGRSPAQQPGGRQPPAQGDSRDQRLNAIEQTLQALLKEVQALRKPESPPAEAPQTPAARGAGGTGGGRRGAAPPASFELSADSIKSLNWRSIGPANMGGRVTSIAVAKNDPSLWWIATGGGGLLKTENNGVTFEHQFDHEATVAVGAVAVAPSESKIVWVGTGEANPRNSVSYGDGVYRSTDGGQKWTHMGLKKTYQIGAIVIHPQDPNIVYVGALGRLYGPNEDRGVYKTTDGGQTWQKVFYVDERTGVIDMVMHPADPETLIAAFWDRERDGFDSWPGDVPKPDGVDGYDPIRKWGKGGGLYKTTDGGKNWKKLTSGLPSSATGRIGLDWQGKNAGTLMAIIDCEAIGKGPPPLPVYLGAVGADVDGKAKITQVLPDSPAAKAGLQVGDIIAGVEEEDISSFDQVLAELRGKQVRDKFELHVVRGEEKKKLEATLTARPTAGQRGGAPAAAAASRVWLGVTGGERDGKVTLLSVIPGGPAAKAMLKEGDVITAVEGKDVKTYEEVTEAVREKRAGDKLALKVTRGTETLEVMVTIEDRPQQAGGPGGQRGGGQRGGANQPQSNVYLGIQGEDGPQGGAKLTVVTEEGPAAKAGLEVNDIVQVLDGQKVADYEAFIAAIRGHQPGDKVKLSVLRGTETKEFELTLAERPGGPTRTRPYTYSYFGQSANVQDQQGTTGYEYGGVYRSRDAGESWERVNSLNTRPMYFSVVRVDPSDDQHVYVLGVEQFQSHNGGVTFAGNLGGNVHADGHALWVDPRDGRHMIIGVDGGVYVTYDRGKNWDHLNTTAIGQFYNVAISLKEPYWVFGGLQDNGSWGGPAISKNGGILNEDWIRVGSGDGFVCRVDPNDPDLVYYESQNGAIGWRHLKTGERGNARPPQRGQGGGQRGGGGEGGQLGAGGYRFNWNTPYILSNHNTKIFYSAGNYVFRSLDRGNDLRPISPEITLTRRGSATALSESPRNPNVLYAGTDDGALWVTRDGGHEWQNITRNLGLRDPRWIASIEASKYAEGRVYVACDGHRSDDDDPYAFVSDDFGQTFRSIKANLPWGSTRVLREDIINQNLLYCGTEFGLWVSLDRGGHWTKLNNNLPTVAIFELAQHPTNGELVAATHGRSLWACDVSALRQLTPDHFREQIALFKPTDLTRWQSEPARGQTNRRFTGRNPAPGAQVWYVLPKKAERVTLRVEDIEGHIVREIRGPVEAGLQRASWDLVLAAPQQPAAGGQRGGGGGQRGAGGTAQRGAGGAGTRGRGTRGQPPAAATTPPAEGGAAPAATEQRPDTGEEPTERETPPPGGQRGGGGGARAAPNGNYRIVLVVDDRELGSQTIRLQRDPGAPASAVLEDATALEARLSENEEEEEREREEEEEREAEAAARRAGID